MNLKDFSPHTAARPHICHRYHRLYSWTKNLSCGEISDFCKEFEQFMEFYWNLCRFCSKFVWRKICVEKISVEKKWQIWGMPPQGLQIENWSKQNPLLIDKARLFKPVDQGRVARVGADIQLTKRILNTIHNRWKSSKFISAHLMIKISIFVSNGF